jgi:hypothetical protein
VKILHQLSHWLGSNSEFLDTYAVGDEVWTCRRCNDCGQARDAHKVMELQDFLRVARLNSK